MENDADRHRGEKQRNREIRPLSIVIGTGAGSGCQCQIDQSNQTSSSLDPKQRVKTEAEVPGQQKPSPGVGSFRPEKKNRLKIPLLFDLGLVILLLRRSSRFGRGSRR